MFALLFAAIAQAAEIPVKVGTDTITLATWIEGPPDSNPPFELLAPSWAPPIYPYAWRTAFTDKKIDHAWRSIYLENEYLRCSFLPDLGGHLYTCRDKLSGKDMFYANPVIKKQWLGLRGAWAAVGLELNFPVGHSWLSVSPVDFATRTNADASGSVFLSSVDRVTGMQWWAEFVLCPGSTVLEQRVALYNCSNVRRRYSWWSDALVQVEDEATAFILPTKLTATHGLSEIDSWPLNSAGLDISVTGNHKGGGIGLFAYNSREPFLAVYHPHSRTGTIHYADRQAVSGQKIWSWGAEGNNWVRQNLSVNDTVYVEIQAGLFQNQETFEFLGPQETKVFTEYWMPVRGLDGISRANPHGVLYLQRSKEAGGRITLTAELIVNHSVDGARIRILDGGRAIEEKTADLTPATTYTRTLPDLPASPHYGLELVDSGGAVLLSHAEGQLAAAADGLKLGKQPPAEEKKPTAELDFLRAGEQQERLGNPDSAYSVYASGLSAFPGSFALLKASGRFSVTMHRFAEGAQRLGNALRVKNDPELRYFFGLATANLGDDGKARGEWTAISANPQFGRPARLQLACLMARSRDYDGALREARAAAGESAEFIRAGAIEVALLRRLDKKEEAKARLAFWRAANPADLFLRYEQFRFDPEADPGFFRQLAADPERVLDIVTQLFELGFYDDSLYLTDRRYDPVDALDREPGAVPPQDYPLVAYYRAFARERLGQKNAAEDYSAASSLSTLNVFPNRPGTVPVLKAAIGQDPNDATAHALLGSLYFSFRMVDEAIAEWQKARSLRSLEFGRAEDVRRDLPALHRNLGRALLEIKKDFPGAAAVLREGVLVDPGNKEVKEALEKALARLESKK